MRRGALSGLLVVSGLAGLIACVSATVAPDEPTPGRLLLDSSEYLVERDSRDPASAVQINVRVINAGGTIVTLEKIESRCGCSVVSAPSKRELGPGEEAEIPVRATPPSTGDKRTYIEVFCDSPTTPVVRASLLLRGSPVEAPYAVSIPTGLSMSGNAGSTAKSEISISTVEKKGAKHWIASLDSKDSTLSASSLGVDEGAGPSEATVRRTYSFAVAKSVRGCGREDSQLWVLSSDQRELKMIPVAVEVFERVRAVPDAIYAHISESSRFPILRVINFLATDGVSLDDLQAEVLGGSCVSANLEDVPDGLKFVGRVRLKIDRPAATDLKDARILRTVLRIRTGDDEKPVVDVPITLNFGVRSVAIGD